MDLALAQYPNSIRLKPGIIEDEQAVKVDPGYTGCTDIYPSFPEYVAAIVSGLDVRVSYIGPGIPKREIHAGNPGAAPSNETLLAQLSFASCQHHDPSVTHYIKDNHHRLRALKYEDRVVGIAAISTDSQSDQKLLGLKTNGGLATSLDHRFASHFIGYIDHKPDSAKRAWTKTIEAPPETIKVWATEQFILLENENITDYERCIAGHNACEFDVDPMVIARVMIVVKGNLKLVSYEELALIAKTLTVGIIKSRAMDHADIYNSVEGLDQIALIKPPSRGESLSLKRDDKGIPCNPNSIIGCLHRLRLSSDARSSIASSSFLDTSTLNRSAISLDFLTSSSSVRIMSLIFTSMSCTT